MSVAPAGGRSGGAAVEKRPGAQQPPSAADVALLWAAAAPVPVDDDVRRTADGADLSLVLETAAAHRVAPLVLRALARAGVVVEPGSTPATAQGSLWRAHAELAVRTAAKAALQPLIDHGFEPLALKGLALVDRYPAPGLRPMDDIDLLLPRSDIGAAGDVLRRAGWRRGRHSLSVDPGYDLVFQHPSIPGVPLELHYEFMERREPAPGLDGRSLWDARVPSAALGMQVWVLPREIELAALISHAAKGFHLMSRLLWIVDLVVVSQTSALDWDVVERCLSRARRCSAGAIALRLAERLGAQVPDRLLRLPPAFEGSATVRKLLDEAAPFDRSQRARWMAYLMVDGILGKLRFVGGDLRRPPGGYTRARIAADFARLAARGFRVSVERGTIRRTRR